MLKLSVQNFSACSKNLALRLSPQIVGAWSTGGLRAGGGGRIWSILLPTQSQHSSINHRSHWWNLSTQSILLGEAGVAVTYTREIPRSEKGLTKQTDGSAEPFSASPHHHPTLPARAGQAGQGAICVPCKLSPTLLGRLSCQASSRARPTPARTTRSLAVGIGSCPLPSVPEALGRERTSPVPRDWAVPIQGA